MKRLLSKLLIYLVAIFVMANGCAFFLTTVFKNTHNENFGAGLVVAGILIIVIFGIGLNNCMEPLAKVLGVKNPIEPTKPDEQPGDPRWFKATRIAMPFVVGIVAIIVGLMM